MRSANPPNPNPTINPSQSVGVFLCLEGGSMIVLAWVALILAATAIAALTIIGWKLVTALNELKPEPDPPAKPKYVAHGIYL